MLIAHSPQPGCAHPRDKLLQALLSLNPGARGTQRASPHSADVPHRRGSVLPPGCGAVRTMILCQANLKDTVTQREPLQHQRGQRLAPSVTLDRSHSPLPSLTGTGTIWVKSRDKNPQRASQEWGDPEPSGGAEEIGWDEVGRDGTGRDHPAHPVLRWKEKPIPQVDPKRQGALGGAGPHQLHRQPPQELGPKFCHDPGDNSKNY